MQLEKNTGGICVLWSTSEEMDHSVSGKETKHRVVNVEEWYGLERLSFELGSEHLVRSNPAVPPITTKFMWSHYRFYVNLFNIDSRAHIDTEV